MGAFVIWMDPAKLPSKRTLIDTHSNQQQMERLFPHSLPSRVLWDACPSSWRGFNCLSFILSETERLCTYLKVICVSFSVNCLSLSYLSSSFLTDYYRFLINFSPASAACLATPFVIQCESASVWC